MKRRIVAILLTTLMTISAVGCGKTQEEKPASGETQIVDDSNEQNESGSSTEKHHENEHHEDEHHEDEHHEDNQDEESSDDKSDKKGVIEAASDDSNKKETSEKKTDKKTDKSDDKKEDKKDKDKDKEKEEEKTLGATLADVFKSKMKKGSSVEETVNALMEKTGYSCGSMEMEEGYLDGFDEDITGFKSCTKFSPYIGTIPFVGYVFETDDVSALKSKLKDSANKSWNICTQADEMVIKSYGDYVFFVMCPSSNK